MREKNRHHHHHVYMKQTGKQAQAVQLSKESESIFMVFIIVRFHINNTKLFNGNYRHV